MNRKIRVGVVGSVLGLAAGGCDPPDQGEAGRARAGIVAAADVQGGGPPPGQRWVLRDVNGAAVNAVVEPTCRGNGPECFVNEIGTVGGVTPQCARVIWLGDQYVDLKYSLTTGRAEDCSPTSTNAWDFGTFADAACAGPFYSDADNGVEQALRFTRRARYIANDDELYFESNQPLVQGTWYAGAGCTPFDADLERFPFLPVPDWAKSALPGPPYQLTWE